MQICFASGITAIGGDMLIGLFFFSFAGASKVTSNTGKFKDNPDGPKVEGCILAQRACYS